MATREMRQVRSRGESRIVPLSITALFVLLTASMVLN
jgi:hypothetical protein